MGRRKDLHVVQLVLVLTLIALVRNASGLKMVNGIGLEQLVSRTEVALVAFTSEITEQHRDISKRLVEELDKLTQVFSTEPRLKIVGLSLDQNPEIFNDIRLSEIPALVIYRDGLTRLYYGQRSASTIYGFLMDLLNSDPVKVISIKQDKRFSDEHAIKFIGYFPNNAPSTLGTPLHLFRTVAKYFQGDILFGIVQDPKLAKAFKLKDVNEVALHKPGQKAITVKLDQFQETGELIEWVNKHKKPLWGMLSFNNMYSVWQASKVTLVVLVNNLEDYGSKPVLTIFKSLAKQYGGHDEDEPSASASSSSEDPQITFVIVNALTYKEFVASLGLSEESIPTLVIFNPIQQKEYIFPKDKQELNLNNARKWVDNFFAGKLTANEREDSVALYSPTDAVVSLDEETFGEVVNDPEKDVLVEFYAPWCGHCRTLSPHYRALAQTFLLFPSVTIAAFNGDENKIPPGYPVSSYPTLLFFPANDKKNFVVFNEVKRDGTALLEFILKHQTTLDDESVVSLKQIASSLDSLPSPGIDFDDKPEL